MVLSICGYARNGANRNAMLCGLWKQFLCEYDTHLPVPVWDEETESELE